MRYRILAMIAAIPALALAAGACGAPKSSGFSPIALGNLPDGLTETTTTTTTMPPTTSSTVEPIITTTLVPVPTTIPTESVTLYFIAGQQLASQQQLTDLPIQTSAVLNLLAQGPINPVGGQRTAIPKNANILTSVYRGVLTINLPANFFDLVGANDAGDERLAVGQLVLTLTQLSGSSLVRFTLNGQPIAVPLGTGIQSEPGAMLAKEDYEVLAGNAPPPTTTTTPTTISDAPSSLPPEPAPPFTG